MAVYYQSEGVKPPSIKKRLTTNWIKQVAASFGKRVEDISYMFCSDEKILEINNQYLQHNYYTDIITFDYSEGDIISGDIFISLDTVKSNSKELCTDYNNELHRVIIHGVLHLCGVNDKTDEEQKYMTECENEALDLLNTFLSV